MDHQKPPPLLEFWLPADPDAVLQARHTAMRVCTEAGITEEDCSALDLALGEALANAVIHSAGQAGQRKSEAKPQVYLGLWSFQNRFIIQVTDNGVGFAPPPPPYKMPEAALEDTHGRGLPLMEVLTDALAVCRGCVKEGGSSVFLIKQMPQ